MNFKSKLNALLFVTVMGLMTLSSCTKTDPVACATIPSSGKVGISLTFSSCSSDAHHEEWDFGDGTAKVTGTSTSHTYSKTGTFTVTLIAANADMSVTSTKTGTIQISQ